MKAKNFIFTFASLFFVMIASTSCIKSQNQDSVGTKKADSPSPETQSLPASQAFSGTVDRDLTKMNSNMVYAEVFNMMIEPELYSGKFLKVKGNFMAFEDSLFADGTKSYAVIVSDALACCQQGLEFLYDFKDGQPEENAEIVVIGRFTLSTLDDGISYNYIDAISVETL